MVGLTDSSKNWRTKKKDRAVDQYHHRYSDKQKIEAVTTYLMLGTIALTSAALKISESTLLSWKKTEWWKDLVQQIKDEENLVLSNKIKKVVDKSWDVVADRMEKGDFIYDQKTGKMKRKPVSLRDASKVAMDSAILRGKLIQEENFTVAADQIDEKLNKLAKAFSDLAKGVKPKESAEDIEYVEVVDSDDEGDENSIHEEWEEGLQEGEPSVQLETGTTKEPK